MERHYSTNNNKFYHSKQWQAVRAQVLERDAYQCQACKRAGRLTIADTVHHIVPVRVDPSRKLDPLNLEAICRACHNKEHSERAKSLTDKKRLVNAEKRHDTAVFSASPEIW